MDEHRAEG
jgi:hypothetical protein